MLQGQFQRRVLQSTAPISRHDDMTDLVTQLEKRLQYKVIGMVMGNEHVIDLLRQIPIGVARARAVIAVADHRIGQDTDAAPLKQHASMAEVADSYLPTATFRLLEWRSCGEESLK